MMKDKGRSFKRVFVSFVLLILLTIVLASTINASQNTENVIKTGDYVGIGIMLGKLRNHILITFIIKGGPAQEAGLKAGDIIVAVDDKPTENLDVADVSKLIAGEKGTPVKITTVSPSDMSIRKDFIITRRDIKYPKSNDLEAPQYDRSKLEIKIGEIEGASAPYPYGNMEYRQLAAINVSAPGAQSYEAYILDKNKNVVKRVYVEEGEYLANGIEQQAKWNEEIYDDPAENINSPSGKYIFTIKCFGYDGRIAKADKEFQIDINPPVLVVYGKNMIVPDGQLFFSADKDVYIKLRTYDEYGNTLEAINDEGKLYEAKTKQKIELNNKEKIRYVWLKATDKYGNTSAKVIDLAPPFSKKLKQYYLIQMTEEIRNKEFKRTDYTNYYNEILIKSQILLENGDPIKALLLLRINENEYPYADVLYGDSEVKRAFGAMAQMEIARIYAEYLQDYEEAIKEYKNAIAKYKDVVIGFIQAYRGPWGKCGIFALLKSAKVYCVDLKEYGKALKIYHDYLKTYADEWEGVWEYAYSFDRQAFNSIISISKTIYGGGDRSIAECRKVIAETKNDDIACEALLKIAEVSVGNAKYGEAVKAYAEIINRYPTAEVTFPYDVTLNYSSVAKTKTLEIYQTKMRDLRKTEKYAKTIINEAKNQADIDFAYKKLDELLPLVERASNAVRLEYKLLKREAGERFCLDGILMEDDNKIYFTENYGGHNFIYFVRIDDILEGINKNQESKYGIKNRIFVEVANQDVVVRKPKLILTKDEKTHEIKTNDGKVLYSSPATNTEAVIGFVSDKNNLYILHPNYVTVKKINNSEEKKIRLNDRKYAWPRRIWISPDSHYLIVQDESRPVRNDPLYSNDPLHGLEEIDLKVIDLTRNGEEAVRTIVLRGHIKDILFSGDSKYFLVNKGRAPYSYKYAGYIPSKIDIYELSTMNNVKTIYVDGDAMTIALSNDQNYLWILSNRDKPILSIVDLRKVL